MTDKHDNQIKVMYSYEWKDDVPLEERDTELNPCRPFCKKMLELRKLYSRADIEMISQKLGYSVFDLNGGAGCRHIWKSNIVVKNTTIQGN